MRLVLFLSLMFGSLTVGSFTARAGTIAFGSITDPSGDATAGQDDLVFASITVDNLNMVTFVAQFTPASFSPGFSNAGFALDLDRNPATGGAGVDTLGNDSALLGVDAAVTIPFLTNPFGEVFLWNGTGFVPLATHYTVTTLADGYSMTLPLSDLGVTSPLFNFKVTSSRGTSTQTGTPVHDRATDIGSPVGAVLAVNDTAAPEPATTALAAAGLVAVLIRRKRKA